MWLIELDELKKEYIKFCELGEKKIIKKKRK